MIARINLTDLFLSRKKSNKPTNETRNELENVVKISFAYNYGAVTIQQQTNTPIATTTVASDTDLVEASKNINLTASSGSSSSSIEDDYYFDYKL
jgi:hypothetical protein